MAGLYHVWDDLTNTTTNLKSIQYWIKRRMLPPPESLPQLNIRTRIDAFFLNVQLEV
jgi:hypothetical protein